jgi:hypothetical protein
MHCARPFRARHGTLVARKTIYIQKEGTIDEGWLSRIDERYVQRCEPHHQAPNRESSTRERPTAASRPAVREIAAFWGIVRATSRLKEPASDGASTEPRHGR